MKIHFAGPWKVGPYGNDVFAPNPNGGERKVCDVRGWGALTGKGDGGLGLPAEDAISIQRANATLIAAAPDMLEALKAVVRVADRDTPEFRDANQAIAKAGG